MLHADILLVACLAYVAMLFSIAYVVDRQTRNGRISWMQSPVVYTLSISIYCTSWTFYGAVGSAARNGLEFITIYLGPTLVFVGWWFLLRKLVRVGRVHRVTSIADLISSRYGKSTGLAVLVTLIAVVATTPYIALQLQSMTLSYQAITGEADGTRTAFWIAAGMALFAIIFGTRNLNANERHHGVVAAIAVEAIVKLVALIAVGLFAVYGLGGGLTNVFQSVPLDAIHGAGDVFGPRWMVLTFLSASAIICLPRQFQVTVVENIDERHLATASWLFPLYLFGMTLFIPAIALAGMTFLPETANPDLYVLTLPLSVGRQDLALLAFLGGFSSATSMVIVAAIAVSTMVSNHVVMPIALTFVMRSQQVSGDVRTLLLISRRVSIGLILGLGFSYFWLSGGADSLASIGLIAFCGVAQFLPSLIGGIFWRGATRAGALTGLIAGLMLWLYTAFLPSLGEGLILSSDLIADGPWGIAFLRPHALLGLTGFDPLIHALVWSLGLNTVLFLIVSGLTDMKPLERLQGAQFVDVFHATSGGASSYGTGSAKSEDLFIVAQRIMGADPAQRLFDEIARAQGRAGGLPYASDAMIARLERELSGSVGAASAHAMVARIAGGQTVSVEELIDIADETQKLITTSRQLEEKSAELERAAAKLQEANDRLRDLDAQKDEFLSQVSHELRTPMTAIRSFTEILMEETTTTEERRRFIAIIHEETLRLTRLIEEILDISRLEAGTLDLPVEPISPRAAVLSAIEIVSAMSRSQRKTEFNTDIPEHIRAVANADRLRQVLINILANSLNYNTHNDPRIAIRCTASDTWVLIDIEDNGDGVAPDEAVAIFEKFTRGRNAGRSSGAGLGLPISRAILRSMGGELSVEFPARGRSLFRLSLVREQAAPQPVAELATGR